MTNKNPRNYRTHTNRRALTNRCFIPLIKMKRGKRKERVNSSIENYKDRIKSRPIARSVNLQKSIRRKKFRMSQRDWAAYSFNIRQETTGLGFCLCCSVIAFLGTEVKREKKRIASGHHNWNQGSVTVT